MGKEERRLPAAARTGCARAVRPVSKRLLDGRRPAARFAGVIGRDKDADRPAALSANHRPPQARAYGGTRLDSIRTL